LAVFDNFSDARVFNKVIFPEFTKYYVKNTKIIEDLQNALVWAHISPSNRVIEWFTEDSSVFLLFKSIQDKSNKITNGNTYKYKEELYGTNFGEDSQYFLFYKGNEVYKARLILVYYYKKDIIHIVFNIEN
jgi:hypothetical protein